MSYGATCKVDLAPGVLIISADEVRRRFGSHWSVDLHAKSDELPKIVEVPQSTERRWPDGERPNWVFPGTPEGLAEAKQWALEWRTTRRNAKIVELVRHQRVHATPHWLLHLFAVAGFGRARRNAREILKRYRECHEESGRTIAFLQDRTDQDNPERVTVNPLQDWFRVLPILEIGTPIWKLSTSEDKRSISIQGITITDVTVYDRSRRDLDLVFRYRTCDGGSFDLEAEVTPDDRQEVSFVLKCGIYGQRLFLNRLDAEEAGRERARAIYENIKSWL